VDTLDFILRKFAISPNGQPPIEISGMTREKLAALFSELGFRNGAEIGVREGEFSEILCQANPQLELFSVDPYHVHPDYKFGRGNEENANATFLRAIKRLEPYNCSLVRHFSMDAVQQFGPESLDFVYIDGNHEFRNVVDDISEWSKRVRKGGIVSGHDYAIFNNHSKRELIQVFHAVTAYTQAYEINPWFVLGRNREPGGDKHRSWMWVK